MSKKAVKAIENITDLTPDPRNANLGSVRGLAALETSLEKYGAGRSILADKSGVVIAGNKTLQTAVDKGFPIRVVQTDGKELVVVQRTDLDLSKDKAAKELAIADNRIAELDLEWSPDVLQGFADEGIDLAQFWNDDELAALLGKVPDFQPVGIDEQGRLDQKKPIVCPHCGQEFVPNE